MLNEHLLYARLPTYLRMKNSWWVVCAYMLVDEYYLQTEVGGYYL